MSPVLPEPKAKPSYMELTDSDEETQLIRGQDTLTSAQRGALIAPEIVPQLVDNEDWDATPLRESSKDKGKARAVSKRSTAPGITSTVQGQTVHVRGTV